MYINYDCCVTLGSAYNNIVCRSLMESDFECHLSLCVGLKHKSQKVAIYGRFTL